MHRKLTLLVPLLLVGALACATMAPSVLTTRRFFPLSAEGKEVIRPPLNTEVVAEVGETMIEKGYVYTRPAIRLLQPVVHKGTSKGPYTLRIPAGILVASGAAGPGPVPGTFFQSEEPLQFHATGQTQVRGGVFVPDSEETPPEVYWHATDTGLPLVDPNPELRFERTTHEDWRSDSFRRQLVYNGRSGLTIKLLYREFSEERIRPAFTQEVTYDLEQGETVGFKGARFQVFGASNTTIKYSVLNHFSK